MKEKSMNRRDFLKLNAGLALSSSSILSLLGSLQTVNAATADDYKALVCVFLEGGNDAFNMVIPKGSAYADYKKIRGSLAVEEVDALS